MTFQFLKMIQISGLSGANNTIKHQNTIAELLYTLMKKVKTTKKYSQYKILPEIGLDKKIPDLIVYKTIRFKFEAIAIFEVCITNALKADIKKCNDLMNNNSTIKEAFIIDITSEKFVFHKLYKLKSGKISKPIKSSKFDVLNLDLSKIV